MIIKEIFKEKKNKNLLKKCIVAFLFPIGLCIIYCMIRDISLSDIYVPASKNNDSLFYFKLVESVRRCLVPRGYFGFNESHAAHLSFAAWSPLILMPWLFVSIIFGWGYTSAVFVNVLLFSVCFALFVVIADLHSEKLGMLMILFMLFPSVFIHLMCILPEAPVAGLMLVFIGIAYRISKRIESEDKIGSASFILLIVTVSYLTLLRPYMAVFFLIPFILSLKAKKKVLSAVSVIAAIVSLAGYFVISEFFTADYFTPLFNLDIIKMFLHGKFTEGFYSALYVARDMRDELVSQVRDAFSYGLTSGTHYVLLLLEFVIAFILLFFKKNKKVRAIGLTYLLAVAGVMSAIILLLQKSNEGGRHIWVFCIAGLAVISLFEKDLFSNIFKCIIGAVLLVFLLRGSLIPTDYDAPIDNVNARETVAYWKDAFKENDVKLSKGISYENTVDWVFIDYVDDAQVVTEYTGLYALPKGMGISCCSPDYILNNFDSLKSRYIFTYDNALVSQKCEEYNYGVVAKYGNSVMYQRY